MPFGHAWTLWQRLPPRYQLTSRYTDDYVDKSVGISSESSASPRLYPTPRPQSSSVNTDISSARDLNVDSRNGLERLKDKTCKSSSFPKRKSDYVSHFQTQQRVSSTRRQFAESPPTPATYRSNRHNVNRRAQTAPAFPVTNPRVYRQQSDNHSINVTKSTPTQTYVFKFDDDKSVNLAKPVKTEGDSHPKKYMVQSTNDAIMYIDQGKVIYFKKSRHDLTSLLNNQNPANRSNCFIADLRRDYLKHPKYNRGHSTKGTRDFSSERIKYNNKLEHILKYYSDNKGDLNQQTPRQLTNKTGTKTEGAKITEPPSRPPSRESTTSPDRLSPSDLIKLHRQSKLHNRQFYLRTPSQEHVYSTKEFSSCRCYMCRVELQLALVTGLPSDIALAATKTKQLIHPPYCDTKQSVNSDTDKGVEQHRKVNVDAQEVNLKSRHSVKFDQASESTNHSAVKPKENTLTISCTIPDIKDTARSESALDTDRTL